MRDRLISLFPGSVLTGLIWALLWTLFVIEAE